MRCGSRDRDAGKIEEHETVFSIVFVNLVYFIDESIIINIRQPFLRSPRKWQIYGEFDSGSE